jgi:ribosomal protein S18 acetylase RimI-like enzyme
MKSCNWGRFLFLKYGTDVVGVVSFHVDNKGTYKLGYREFSQQYNPISGLMRLWGYRLLSARHTHADSYICHFFIKPVARRAGLGSRLLGHWLQHIRQYQVESAELDVFQKNFRAIALYQKCGFRVIKKSSLPLIGRLLPDSSLLRLSISLH